MKYQFNPFFVEYDTVTSPPADFTTECVEAAHNAVKKNIKNLPIIVLMSGGLDSEMVARMLLQAGIPFKCLLGKLQIEVATKTLILNEHDYSYAEKWCRSNNIEIEYCSVDLYKDAKLLTEYALSGSGFSPQLSWFMYMIKWCHDNNYFFMGGFEEMEIVLREGEYFCKDFQRDMCIQHFVDKNNLYGMIRYWKQDSRILSAFLEIPTVRQLMNDKVKNLVDHKFEYFSEIFPDIEDRPKLTGFERLQEWDNILRAYMKQINGQYDDVFYTPISFFTPTGNK